MSLADLQREREDAILKLAIKNAFAVLTDEDILRVAQCISYSSATAAADAIIAIIGPQSKRTGVLIPGLLGGATLADQEGAGKVVTLLAKAAGQPVPTKAELKDAVTALPLTPDERSSALNTIENVGLDALGWGAIGRVAGSFLVAIATRLVPELRFATFTRSLITGAATLVGATAGATHGADQSFFPK